MNETQGFAPAWQSPPEKPALCRSEVHVWRARIEPEYGSSVRLRRFLDESEIERAARLGWDAIGARFAMRRGVLRCLLGSYLKVDPKDVRLDYGPDGKPELQKALYPSPLRFNLSRSGEWLLCAVAIARRVGTDLEKVRPIRTSSISERFFQSVENEYLQRLSGHERDEAFFRIWTFKEAYAKARGLDLLRTFIEPEQVPPSMNPGTSSLFGFRQMGGVSWLSYSFRAAPGYAATVLVEGRGCRFSHWSFGGS